MSYSIIIPSSRLFESRDWLLCKGYDHDCYANWQGFCKSGDVPREKIVGSRYVAYFSQGKSSDVEVFFHESFKQDAMEFKLIFGVKSVIDVY